MVKGIHIQKDCDIPTREKKNHFDNHKSKCDKEQVQMEEIKCDQCDMKFQSEINLKVHSNVIHMYNSGDSTSVCKTCTEQETCESCIEAELD